NIRVNRFRADCGSCSKEIVSEIEKHCKHFYIRANRCSSLYLSLGGSCHSDCSALDHRRPCDENPYNPCNPL
ncbi:MAG: hypothetical protein SPL58_09190, partial [Bacteroidaceae bacterium]|nr:hypothetical protein [Bacteroidaceae bacterium]